MHLNLQQLKLISSSLPMHPHLSNINCRSNTEADNNNRFAV